MCASPMSQSLEAQLMHPSTPAHPFLLAIPKKGRLFEQSTKLLNDVGLHFKKHPRSDIAHCTAVPVTLVFLNACDIPTCIAEGNVDGGIVGQDVVAEAGVSLPDQTPLGFGKCVLALQAPVRLKATPEDCIGKRIVTSFPNLARKYFACLEQTMSQSGKSDSRPYEDDSDTTTELQLKTRVVRLSGSVEASVSLGLSDAVIDLVESGETMRMAGLEEIDILMKTEAVFILHAQHQDMAVMIKKRIRGWVTAQKFQMISYNIHRDHLQSAIAITPGLRSPNITSLAEVDWFSVTAVVEKMKVLDAMDKLEGEGARDILTFDFKHCRFDNNLF